MHWQIYFNEKKYFILSGTMLKYSAVFIFFIIYFDSIGSNTRNILIAVISLIAQAIIK